MRHAKTALILTLLIGVLFLFGSTGCSTTSAGISIGPEPGPPPGPPPHAKAYGYRAKYSYYYYPCEQVYFDVSRRVYFYVDGGEWRMSASLPSSLNLQLGEHVTIDMDTDKPYTQFEKHKKEYPPGQSKKKKR